MMTVIFPDVNIEASSKMIFIQLKIECLANTEMQIGHGDLSPEYAGERALEEKMLQCLFLHLAFEAHDVFF